MDQTNLNTYIVFLDNDDIFLVKAKNTISAIDKVYNTYIKPFQTENKENGYKLYKKSDLYVKSVEELLDKDDVVILN